MHHPTGMHHPNGLSASHEMYLKIAYRLERIHGGARVKDIARVLELTPGSVSTAIKRLQSDGFVTHDRYGTARLTEAGIRAARCVNRRFEVLYALLVEVLALPTDVAERDACAMEHAVGPATVTRMERLIELVRADRIDLGPLRRARRSGSACCDCEADGYCHAATPDRPHTA